MFEDMKAINDYVERIKSNDIEEKTAREIVGIWIAESTFEEGELRGALEEQFRKTKMK